MIQSHHPPFITFIPPPPLHVNKIQIPILHFALVKLFSTFEAVKGSKHDRCRISFFYFKRLLSWGYPTKYCNTLNIYHYEKITTPCSRSIHRH